MRDFVPGVGVGRITGADPRVGVGKFVAVGDASAADLDPQSTRGAQWQCAVDGEFHFFALVDGDTTKALCTILITATHPAFGDSKSGFLRGDGSSYCHCDQCRYENVGAIFLFIITSMVDQVSDYLIERDSVI